MSKVWLITGASRGLGRSFTQEVLKERRQNEEERQRHAEAEARAVQEQAVATKTLADGLARLAKGDLTVRITKDFAEAYRQIKDDFNATIERLHETIRALAQATGEVSSASAEITAIICFLPKYFAASSRSFPGDEPTAPTSTMPSIMASKATVSIVLSAIGPSATMTS